MNELTEPRIMQTLKSIFMRRVLCVIKTKFSIGCRDWETVPSKKLTLLQWKNEVLGKRKWYLFKKRTEPVTKTNFNNAEDRAQPRSRHKVRTRHFAFTRTFSISNRYDSCKLQLHNYDPWMTAQLNSSQTGYLC